jgi:pimeloyl-ACP methyl ester carboxylesterase
MPTIPVRDTELYVERAGSGPELLFVHGMCGDASVWAGQVARLSDRFTCVTFDRRGHSRSARGSEPESVETHAADAAALIEVLGLERPVLVGSSGGARIAVELARRRPELIRAAVFSEPPIFGLDPSAAAAFVADIRAAVGPALEARDPRAAVDAFFPLVCPGLWGVLDEDGRNRLRANGRMMIEELAGAPYRLGPGDLPAIDVPALVLSGSESHPSLRAFAEVLARGLPVARSRELRGSGHVTYAERPAEFARAVADFAAEAFGQAGRPRSSRSSRTSALVELSES